MSVAFLFNLEQPPHFAYILTVRASVQPITSHQPRNFSVAGFVSSWDGLITRQRQKIVRLPRSRGIFEKPDLPKKGTSFMFAKVAQVTSTNGILSARAMQNGRLSKNLIYTIRAFSTFTGNPDNEHKRRKRHWRRLSKNLGTLHCPYRRARNRLRALVPHP
jgi:hypothetical protein